MFAQIGFFRDILANPEDDTPRLIYADWLDDQGDEARAEFIRLQCELARLKLRGEENQHLQSRKKFQPEKVPGANAIKITRYLIVGTVFPAVWLAVGS